MADLRPASESRGSGCEGRERNGEKEATSAAQSTPKKNRELNLKKKEKKHAARLINDVLCPQGERQRSDLTKSQEMGE